MLGAIRGTVAGGALDDEFRDPGRFERGVDRAQDVEQRAATFNAASEHALKDAQPRRHVEARRRKGNLARAPQLRSALASRADRRIQRDRSPRPIGHASPHTGNYGHTWGSTD